MPQKLTLLGYLEGRGTVKALTRIEAEVFGIPYPLQSGWPAKHAALEITASMLEQLAERIGTAKQSTASKARRGLEGAMSGDSGAPHIGRSVAILSADGVPVHIMSLTQATALDTLSFVATLMDEIGLEQMALKEGKTFNHFLGIAIGAQPIGVISEYPKVGE